jgi:hypothetical protein
MPDLGIGEAAAAFGLGDFLGLGSLFGGADVAAAAAAPAFETGLATIGGTAGAAATGGLADLVGTGTALAGGATGLEGTLLAGGATGGLEGALGLGGATALGTAEAFLGAPAASGFNAAAITPGIGVFDQGPGVLNAASGAQPTAIGGATSLSPNVANANAAIPGGSVFDTGSAAVPGVNAAGAPSAVPAGGGASAISAPAGVTAPADVTAAATGAAPAAAGGATPSSIEGLLGKAGGGVIDSLTKNPLGIGLGAAGLGYNILQGQKQSANQKALTADANTATANSNKLEASGEDLQKYLTNGTLPAAYQSQVDQAIQDAKTTAISNAAQQGQPTDPTQNTTLAATLAKIDASRAGMQAQVASQLFSSGQGLINAGQGAAGLSGQLFQALVQNDTTQAANTGKAIATLAAALNGRSSNSIGGTNISVSPA